MLYNFLTKRLAMVLDDNGAGELKAILDADKANIHPNNLSGLILCLIRAKTTDAFLNRFQAVDGLQVWYKMSRRYKKLDNYGLVTVLNNWWTGCSSTRSNLTRRHELFRIAEFYCPKIATLRNIFLASILKKKDLYNFLAANNMLNDKAKFEEVDEDIMIFMLEKYVAERC